MKHEQLVEEMTYSLFIEHLESLIQEAEMAVRYEVKDKEEYYERLRVGSRSLCDAIRNALTTTAQRVREETIEEIRDWVTKNERELSDPYPFDQKYTYTDFVPTGDLEDFLSTLNK